jgi:hypothetical protein
VIQFEVVDTQEGNGERGWIEVSVVDRFKLEDN